MRTSSGSADVTAEIQTDMPRTNASRKVRTFAAKLRILFILPYKKVWKESLHPYLLRSGSVGAEERGEDLSQTFGIDAADHASGM